MYLYYFLGQPRVVRWITNQAVGATMPNLNTGILRSITVRYPRLPIQKRIASILSAYDDLIENNTRRIKILEGMAQRIYREWFVHFRFPGHENVRMVESELGPIPEGWTICSLRELSSFIGRGISPKYDDSADGLVINQKCIRNHRLSIGLARKQSKRVPSGKVVLKGDVLINSTGVGTLGRVAQVHQELRNTTVDGHITIVRPKKHPGYVGELAIELEPRFESIGVGSTGQTELARERVSETIIVCPPDSLQSTFSGQITSFHQMIMSLIARNDNLRATRDLLLPKLVSGEISVDMAEEAIASAAS